MAQLGVGCGGPTGTLPGSSLGTWSHPSQVQTPVWLKHVSQYSRASFPKPVLASTHRLAWALKYGNSPAPTDICATNPHPTVEQQLLQMVLRDPDIPQPVRHCTYSSHQRHPCSLQYPLPMEWQVGSDNWNLQLLPENLLQKAELHISKRVPRKRGKLASAHEYFKQCGKGSEIRQS